MTGYGQFCPVSKAAEVLCQRWTPLILREVLTGSSRFNEIRRGVPTCSPALLTKRLRELEAAGVLERGADGTTYHPTDAGMELLPLILGLGQWGQRWARSDYGPEDLDPGLLLWDVRRYLAPGLDEVRVVVQLIFPSAPAKRRFYWVIVDTQEIDLCLTDPGHPVDVVIEANLRSLTQVWMGDVQFVDEVAAGRIVLRGPAKLTRRIPAWFGQHPGRRPIMVIAQLDHARAEFGALLAQRLPEAAYRPPEASYLAWVDVGRLELGPEPARVFLDRGRVALGDGPNFGAPGAGHVRVTIGTSSALLADIVNRMAIAVAG